MSTMAFIPLSADAIDKVNSTSRRRGQYKAIADDFLASDMDGIQINFKDGPLKGKKPNSVKQGFATVAAKDEYKDKFRVVENDNEVYLLRIV